VKHLIVVGVLSIAAAGDACAQITEIQSRWGGSGSHFQLSSGTQTFLYQATVTGCTAPFQVQLEVFHNGVLKHTDVKFVPIPQTSYVYTCPVGMSGWGLNQGDTVTFALKVIDSASGAVLATHLLYGDVTGT